MFLKLKNMMLQKIVFYDIQKQRNHKGNSYIPDAFIDVCFSLSFKTFERQCYLWKFNF